MRLVFEEAHAGRNEHVRTHAQVHERMHRCVHACVGARKLACVGALVRIRARARMLMNACAPPLVVCESPVNSVGEKGFNTWRRASPTPRCASPPQRAGGTTTPAPHAGGGGARK
eukprot:6199009-Pleurochrysis_carterae.AAC.1